MTAEFEPGGVLAPTEMQRVIYVLSGDLKLEDSKGSWSMLRAGSFALLSSKTPDYLTAQSRACAIIIDRYSDVNVSPALVGHEDEIIAVHPVGEEGISTRSVLAPFTGLDISLNIETFVRGASMPQVETHVKECGVLMVEGSGVYRVADAWYNVAAGDFLWIAPSCPHWFACIGKSPAKLLVLKIYQNT